MIYKDSGLNSFINCVLTLLHFLKSNCIKGFNPSVFIFCLLIQHNIVPKSGLILHRSILDPYSTILCLIPEKCAAVLNLCQVTVYPCLFITIFPVWFSFLI